MRIGNQSVFWANPMTEPFAYALASGFDAFEWFPDRPDGGGGWAASDVARDMRAWIGAAAREHDIALSVHASLRSNPFEADGLSLLLSDVELASDLGAGLVNIHLDTSRGAERFVDALAPVASHLAGLGIRLAIENTVVTGPADFNELFAHTRRLGGPFEQFGMCLDIGHANLYGVTRNAFLEYVDQLDAAVPIIHVHVHENHGDRDSHLTLFTGPAGENPAVIDGLVDRLSRRCFSGAMILEQWPEPPELLVEASRRLREAIERA